MRDSNRIIPPSEKLAMLRGWPKTVEAVPFNVSTSTRPHPFSLHMKWCHNNCLCAN